jgi:histone chaperone ASF1
LLSCAYAEKEFIRVGYYVNNDYADEELRENPPAQPDLQKIQRHILAEKPRVFYCFYI